MKERKIIDNVGYSLQSVWKCNKGLFLLYFFNTFLSKVQPFLFIFFPKVLIDSLSDTKNDFTKIFTIIVVFILAIMVTNFLQRYTYGMTSIRFVTYRLLKKRDLASKTIDIEYQHLENPAILDAYNRAVSACNSWNTGMEGMLRQTSGLIMSAVSTVGFVGILITLDWKLTIALLAISVIYHFVKMKMVKVDIKYREEFSIFFRKSGYFTEIMSNTDFGKDIRLYNLKNFMAQQFKNAKDGLVRLNRAVVKEKNKWYLLTYLLDIANIVGYFGFLIFKMLRGVIGVGSFIMYINTFVDFTSWFEDIVSSFSSIKLMTREVDDYRNIMGLPSIEEKENINVDKIEEIEFKNVWFKYCNSENYTLKEVNFKIMKNEKVALVGVNGSGKTTIVKLICGFYMPTEGEVLINNIPIKRINKKSLLNQLAVVFQELNIFAFSIAANVALSEKNNIDEVKVVESLNKAGWGKIIDKAPKGIDTVVQKTLDEEGIELSGGENQGIAIARTIYKDQASVIILDEPTAHFDALMEDAIYKQYKKISDNRISLFISHRLASTQFCDRIVLIDDGRILETGTHTQLLAKDSKYKEMFMIQAKYYNEESVMK